VEECTSEQQKYCEERFHNIDRTLDRIEKGTKCRTGKILRLLQGNGHVGLVMTVDRLVQKDKTKSKLIWIILGAVIPLIITVSWRIISKGF
jgi:hypothetical protein